MISREAIQDLIKKYQTDTDNVWREYFQHLFLSYFYTQEHTELLYFKGGTALRILYQSPRFSEDLDFSSDLLDTTIIEVAIINALEEIERAGIRADIIDAKSTTGGYLATLKFFNNGDAIPIRIEISLRKGTNKGDFATISNDFLPPYTIVQLNEEQLIKEKISAFLSRKKPRDFYDIYFLLRSRMIQDKNSELLKSILAVVEQTTIRFDTELKHFLPKSHWMIIKDLKATLARELKRYL